MHSDSHSAQKLVIGTAQFGFDYGISNKSGVTLPDEARNIIHVAEENGVFEVDAAPAYGECEQVLGSILPDKAEIVTKTGIAQKEIIDKEVLDYFEAVFHESLSRLRRREVRGLLVHDADDLLKPGGTRIARWLQEKKQEGLVKLIGVSVYTVEQLEKVERCLRPDIVQLPFSILDQRLVRSGHVRQLRKRGIQIYARSVFLQGLLLMELNDLPAYFSQYRQTLYYFHDEAAKRSLSPVALALAYVLAHKDIDKVVVGVNSVRHLEEILEATSIDLATEEFDGLFSTQDGLLNPSLWKV